MMNIKGFEELITDENILFLMEVGGSIVNAKAKDIDYIIIVKNLKLFRRKLEQLFGSISVLDDSYRAIEQLPQLNFAIFTTTSIFSKLERYSTQNAPLAECREWIIGYWIPEILIQDVIKGKIIIDRLNGNPNFKNIFQFHKTKILKNYKLKIRGELSIKSNIFQFEKSFFKKELLRNDLILAIMRYIQIHIDSEYLNFSKLIDKQEVFIFRLLELSDMDFLNKLSEIIGFVDEGCYYAIDFWNMET